MFKDYPSINKNYSSLAEDILLVNDGVDTHYETS